MISERIGKIFNIQRFSIYDGPGIRTVVFFAGCNLRCLWCHNPESIPNRQQLKYNADQCIMCGNCFHVCPNGSHIMVDGEHTIDRSKCAVCLDCTAECYAEALVPVCREVTLAQLEKSILTDLEYFRQSNGGVTFSGGESMLQIDYLAEILKVCKRHGIHTAVDTAGAVSFEAFERILPYCDLILYDIKAYNGDVHKKLTGVSNTLVLDNIKRLSELNRTALWVRVPVVVGANIDEMVGIADFLRGIKFQKCELLAYHRLGEGKYKSLGITNQHVFDTPDDELLNKIKDIFKANNITV